MFSVLDDMIEYYEKNSESSHENNSNSYRRIPRFLHLYGRFLCLISRLDLAMLLFIQEL